MSRIKYSVPSRRRRKKILKQASGYHGARHRLVKTAKEARRHALDYAYIGRRLRKRQMRRLWIQRINAAARANGMSYSTFMDGLRKAGIEVDRKMLADLAVKDATVFAGLVESAKKAVAA